MIIIMMIVLMIPAMIIYIVGKVTVWECFHADGVLELLYFLSIIQWKCNEYDAIWQTQVSKMHISVQ